MAEKISSREYKVIVDVAMFADIESARAEINDELARLAKAQPLEYQPVPTDGQAKLREILFLDTPDFALRNDRLLLRRRVTSKNDKQKYEFTLKCRDEDRYIAGEQHLAPSDRGECETKFEEDIGVPFVSRFSKSATLILNKDDKYASDKLPSTIAAAGKLFPRLLSIPREGSTLAHDTPLLMVQGNVVTERVYEGLTFLLPHDHTAGDDTLPAKVALILWSRGKKGRPLTAELSFRYEADDEQFSLSTARAARKLFASIQQQAWARPDAMTKTQFMYAT